MGAAVFAELAEPRPRRRFTVGIVDDVTHLSLKPDPSFSTERDDVVRAVFYGLGSDGTVGANKNSVKIIGESTPLYAQGYFVYDSKKSGLDHRLAPPLQPQADQLLVPDRAGQLRGLPPVRVPGTNRRAGGGRARRDVPPQQPLRTRRGLGPAAGGGPAADHRQEAAVLRRRRPGGGPAGGPRRPDQHGHADLLLRPGGHPPSRRGDRQDQGRDPQDLRQAGRDGPAAELRGRRRRARRPA